MQLAGEIEKSFKISHRRQARWDNLSVRFMQVYYEGEKISRIAQEKYAL
jgi:hypothetical protein